MKSCRGQNEGQNVNPTKFRKYVRFSIVTRIESAITKDGLEIVGHISEGSDNFESHTLIPPKACDHSLRKGTKDANELHS